MNFKDFREKILGKVYTRDYRESEIYIVVDVCGRPNSNSEKPEIKYAEVIYLYFTRPSEMNTTSFYNDNMSISIGHKEVSFNQRDIINSFKKEWHENSNISIDDAVNYYKTLNAAIKSYLREIGANL